MKLGFIASVFVLAVAPLVAERAAINEQSAVAPAEQEIGQLLRAWDDAYRQRDVQGLGRILADGFTLTDASGAVLTKAEYLMSIVKTPDSARLASYASEDVTIGVDGNTAVVTGRSAVKGRPRGKAQASTGSYRFTDSWVKVQGSWKAVATTATR